jgi:adenine phosphoribosyltransferase
VSQHPDLDLRAYIRDIPDFPKPGILFRDITPLLATPIAFREAIERLADAFRNTELEAIVTAEARGFLFAAPLAMELGLGLVPIRKAGKLPYQTHKLSYDLEYGSDSLEMHVDGIRAGDRVLVVDDLLATGGTIEACCQLVERNGAQVTTCVFAIELMGLAGRERIAPRPTFSLIQY